VLTVHIIDNTKVARKMNIFHPKFLNFYYEVENGEFGILY